MLGEITKEAYVLIAVAVVAVVLIVAAAALFAPKGSANVTSTVQSQGSAATTSVQSQASTTVSQGASTSIVIPVTVPGKAVNASCDGYALSVSQPFGTARGFCNWGGGIVNITINGGMFSGVVLTASEPGMPAIGYNGTTCKRTSGGYFLPLGNFNLSLSTGAATGSASCGNATANLVTG